MKECDSEDEKEKEDHPDVNEEKDSKRLTKKERIDKLIAERLKRSGKILKEDIISNNVEEGDNENDSKDENEDGDENDEDEYENGDDDNLSDLEEFDPNNKEDEVE